MSELKPSPGRVIVARLGDIEEAEGFAIPTHKRNSWATVKAIGAPQSDIFTWWQKVLYAIARMHPCPYKVGYKVLMPNIPSRTFDMDGQDCFIFWQSEIEVYEK